MRTKNKADIQREDRRKIRGYKFDIIVFLVASNIIGMFYAFPNDFGINMVMVIVFIFIIAIVNQALGDREESLENSA